MERTLSSELDFTVFFAFFSFIAVINASFGSCTNSSKNRAKNGGDGKYLSNLSEIPQFPVPQEIKTPKSACFSAAAGKGRPGFCRNGSVWFLSDPFGLKQAEFGLF
jgi:hypothetical protein